MTTISQLSPTAHTLLVTILTDGGWALILFFATYFVAYLGGLELVLSRDYGKPHKWLELNALLFGHCTNALIAPESDGKHIRISGPLDDKSLTSLQKLVLLQVHINRARARLVRLKRRGRFVFLGFVLSVLAAAVSVSPVLWGGTPLPCTWGTVAPLWGGIMVVLVVFPQAWMWHTAECDIRALADKSREDKPADASSQASPVLTRHMLCGRGVKIASRKSVTLRDLKGRTCCMLVSMKNPRFSKGLLNYYCRLLRETFMGGLIAVVDEPYKHNAVALGLIGNALEKESQKLARISHEVQTRVRRCVKDCNATFAMYTWRELVNETPAWLADEVRRAFDSPGSFRDELIALSERSVGEAVGASATADKEKWAQFLVEELPVLLYLYYIKDGGYVDVYPGECPHLFWKIEIGNFEVVLPKVTLMVKNATPLVYLDIAETAS